MQFGAAPARNYFSNSFGTLSLLVDNFIFPNGLAFSSDESVLYVNDSRHCACIAATSAFQRGIAMRPATSSGSVAVQHPPRRETGICSLIVGFSGGADLGSVRGSNDAVLAQGGELLGVHAQPRAEHVVDMLAEQRRRLDRRRCTVE